MDAPEFNTVKPFLSMSQEMQQTNPMIAYYIKTFAVQKAHTLYKQLNPNSPNYKSLGQNLSQWINELTQIKQNNPQLFNDKQQNQAEFQNYVMKFFFDTDSAEREGEVSKELVKNFLACSRLFEALTYFEPLHPEQDEKRKYSKLKAVELTKKLKNPDVQQKQQSDDFEKQMRDIEKKVQSQKIEEEPHIGMQKSVLNQQSIQPQSQPQQIPSNNQPIKETPYDAKASVFEQMPRFIPKQGQSQVPSSQSQFQQPMAQSQQQQPTIQQQPNMQQQGSSQQAGFNQNIAQQVPKSNQQVQQQPNYNQSAIQPSPQPVQQNNYPQYVQTINAVKSLDKLSAIKIAEKRNLAKKLLEHAISELDFKKYTKAKENLEQALQIVQELELQ